MRQSFLPRTVNVLAVVLLMVSGVMTLSGPGARSAAALGGGSISGTVYDSTGAPTAAGITLEGPTFDYGGSDATGQFRFDGLPDGSYTLYVYPYSGTDVNWVSGPIDVVDGQTTVQDVHLVQGGTIYGSITAGGSPVSASLTLHAADGSVVSGWADWQGIFTVSRLAPGDYRLHVEDVWGMFGREWQGEWYDNTDAAHATVITVGAGDVIALPVIDLERFGEFSGRVTDSDGNPVPYMNVYAVVPPWPASGQYFVGETDADGRYTIQVPRGEYFVYFWSPFGPGEFFDDTENMADAHIFQVTGSERFTADAVLPAPVTISGTVTHHGTPEQWVNVVLVDANGEYVRSATTDVNGDYVLYVAARGVYTVCVLDWHWVNECWLDQPEGLGTPIDMTTATSFDADMDILSAPYVSGRVTDQDGMPMEGIPIMGWSDTTDLWTYVYTDVDGRYRIMGEVGDVNISANPWGGPYSSETQTVSLAPDQELQDVDFVLYVYAAVHGHVETDAGPLQWQTVRVTGDGVDQIAQTDWNGDYRVWALEPGTYTVTVEPDPSTWYSTSSQTVTVGWGDDPAIDFTVGEGGRIAGTVTSNRDALPGKVRVDVISPSTLQVVASTWVNGTAYETPTVSPGAYYLQFRPADGNRHAAEYWDDSTSLGRAKLVTVAAREITTADAQLQLRGVATAYVPLEERRAVEVARASFAERNPYDSCWYTTLDVTVMEATTVAPNKGVVTTRTATLGFTARNDCWMTTAYSTSTVDLTGADASVDPFTGAHLRGVTIPIDGGGYFADFTVDLTWTAAGTVTTIVSHNGEPVPGSGAAGTHTVEKRSAATMGGSVTSSPSNVVRFTTDDLVDSSISTYIEVIVR